VRLLECALLLADVLAFLVVAIPVISTGRWMRYLPALALVIAFAQLLVEGSRWQMLLAYVLAVTFAILGWRQNMTATRKDDERTRPHRIVAYVTVALGALLLALAAALPTVLPVFRFPRRAGPYAIGTVTYHWIDTSRAEAFATDSTQRRQLMVQIWYPAVGSDAAARGRYMPDADIVTVAFAHILNKRAFLFPQLRNVTSNAMLSVPVAVNQPRWPVLIFVEGAAGFRQMNTFQVEHLVSNDYVVVAIDQPGAAAAVVFPDGHQAVGLTVPQFHAMVRPSYMPGVNDSLLAELRMPNGYTLHANSIIPYLSQDVSFTIDRLAALNRADPYAILTGRLDLQRVGTFGVSLGGIVVGETCRRDARVRACLVMDAAMSAAVVNGGLQQPTMWLTRDAADMRRERERAGGWPEAEIEAHQTSMRAVYARLPGAGYFVRVSGMFHSNFTDIPTWTPLARQFAIAGPINADRAHDIVNAYTLAFFNRHLLGRPSILLDAPVSPFPEVRFESRRP
jgi:predicted dienelactone hydrolase